jgi:hypothetical protein
MASMSMNPGGAHDATHTRAGGWVVNACRNALVSVTKKGCEAMQAKRREGGSCHTC